MNKARMWWAVGLLAFAGVAQAQAISGEPYVAVRGSASQEVRPDTFPVKITLSDTSTNAAATQAKIEKLASDVLALVAAAGVEEADLKVANLSISPEYKYNDRTEQQIFLGNTYSRDIGVRFHSLDKLRDFIAALPADKALRVDTETFVASNNEELRRGLLKQAIENARATAESLAQGVGRKLGPVHTISNQGFNVRYSDSPATTLDTVTVTAARDQYRRGVLSLREGRITLDQSVYIIYKLE